MRVRSLGPVDLFGLPTGDAPSVSCASLAGLRAPALRAELLGIRSADVVRRPSMKRALIDGTEVDSVRMRPLQGPITTPEHIRFRHACALAASLDIALIQSDEGLRITKLRDLADIGLVLRGEVDPDARPTLPGARGISDPSLFGVTLAERLTWCAYVEREGVRTLMRPIATRSDDIAGQLHPLLLPTHRPCDFAFEGAFHREVKQKTLHLGGEVPLEVPREVLAVLLQPMLVGLLQDELRASTEEEAELITRTAAAAHIVDPLIDAILEARPLLLSCGTRWTSVFARRGAHAVISSDLAQRLGLDEGASLVGHLPLGDEAVEEARAWAETGDVSEAPYAHAFAPLEGDVEGLIARLGALADADTFFPCDALDVAILFDGRI